MVYAGIKQDLILWSNNETQAHDDNFKLQTMGKLALMNAENDVTILAKDNEILIFKGARLINKSTNAKAFCNNTSCYLNGFMLPIAVDTSDLLHTTKSFSITAANNQLILTDEETPYPFILENIYNNDVNITLKQNKINLESYKNLEIHANKDSIILYNSTLSITILASKRTGLIHSFTGNIYFDIGNITNIIDNDTYVLTKDKIFHFNHLLSITQFNDKLAIAKSNAFLVEKDSGALFFHFGNTTEFKAYNSYLEINTSTGVEILDSPNLMAGQITAGGVACVFMHSDSRKSMPSLSRFQFATAPPPTFYV